jgi:hypothetical protein
MNHASVVTTSSFRQGRLPKLFFICRRCEHGSTLQASFGQCELRIVPSSRRSSDAMEHVRNHDLEAVAAVCVINS